MTINQKYILLLSFLLILSGCSNISLEKEIELYPNGSKKRELTYKGNYFQMELVKSIDFYSVPQSDDPPKLSEMNYENNSLNGKQEHWYKNGTKKMVLNYRYGLMHGEQLGWFVNGKNKFKRNYNFGNLDGIQYTYIKNGNLDRKKLYRSGKLIRIIKD
ncbi:MAG: hypothetical protein H8E60_01565 [Candidatus Marinimicrobia bacterium]|nr:hypothetical protein [Candidatus Neomarinimicrobiota bacterium]